MCVKFIFCILIFNIGTYTYYIYKITIIFKIKLKFPKVKIFVNIKEILNQNSLTLLELYIVNVNPFILTTHMYRYTHICDIILLNK